MKRVFMAIYIDAKEELERKYASNDVIPITVDKSGIWTIYFTMEGFSKVNEKAIINSLANSIRCSAVGSGNPEERVILSVGIKFGSSSIELLSRYDPNKAIYTSDVTNADLTFTMKLTSFTNELTNSAAFKRAGIDAVVTVAPNVRDFCNRINIKSEDDGDEYDEYDEEYDDDDDEDVEISNDAYELLKAMGLDIEDIEKKPKARKNSKNTSKSGKGTRKSPTKKSYSKSRVIDAAHNPKKSYKRHGVVIYNNKKYMKHDRNIIKEFLKDFIPGNSEWKKAFRKDVLERWMKDYAVSKKRLKRLEKAYTDTQKPATRHIDTNKILDYTNRVLRSARSESQWNNPNK